MALFLKHYEVRGTDPPIPEIYIHGWVYDLEEGKVLDLGISVGPPGKQVPPSPFPLVN